jgi:hypothetical protein
LLTERQNADIIYAQSQEELVIIDGSEPLSKVNFLQTTWMLAWSCFGEKKAVVALNQFGHVTRGTLLIVRKSWGFLQFSSLAFMSYVILKVQCLMFFPQIFGLLGTSFLFLLEQHSKQTEADFAQKLHILKNTHDSTSRCVGGLVSMQQIVAGIEDDGDTAKRKVSH